MAEPCRISSLKMQLALRHKYANQNIGILEMPKMRAKMKVAQVESHSESSQTLHFGAVSKSDGYPEGGLDENNTFATYTPSADLTMLVSNPSLVGQFEVGEEYYLDFSKAD